MDSQKKLCLTKLEQAGLPTSQPLDQLGQCLASFDDKISSLRGEQEAAAKGIQTDQKRTSQLAQEDKCPLCIQPLTGQYKTDLLQRIEQENVERQRIINHLRLEVADLQKAKTKLQNFFWASNLFSPRNRFESPHRRRREQPQKTSLRVGKPAEP
jgi:DNA repair exonuclease SbcCD ATPase subunit